MVVLALVMLPTLMGAASVSGRAPLPSAAGIRSAAVHLVDWVTGRHAPAPSVPQQQAGKAPGTQHQVPAAVTRAVARAEGRAASEAHGQLPSYVFPAAKVKQHVTGAAPASLPVAGTPTATPSATLSGTPSATPSGTPSTAPSTTPSAVPSTATPAATAGTGSTASTPASSAATSSAATPAGSTSATAVTDAFYRPAGNPGNGVPQVNDQWPSNGYNVPTLTPELIASGSDSDGDTLGYDFTVYDASGNTLADSGWISSNDWDVPSGDLVWDQTYYWTVVAGDGTSSSPDPQVFALQTPVPQPLLYEGLSQDGSGPDGSQNGSGPVFDPQNGNFTTAATDVSVPVTGPALSIQRTYNSLEPIAPEAFGAGWSSVLDMQVSPARPAGDGSTATLEVSYPDGEKIAFGANADGSYTSPQGRYGTLVPASGGGFELVDKDDTTYTFSQSLGSGSYAISSVADAQGHALNFTYSSGVVTKMTSAVSQRSLYLTWSTPSGAYFPHVATVSTDPVTPGSPSTALTWQYNYTGDQLQSACDESQSGQPCTSYTYQSGSGYPAAVLDSGPQSYWRLNEDSGSTAASSVLANEGTDNATYNNVVQDVQQGPLAGSASSVGAAGFENAYVQVPDSLADEAGAMSISLWFNSTATNGVLFSQSADPVTSSTTTNPYSSLLYIGSDGKLQGGFAGTGAPLSSSAAVNDGNWHNVVLTSCGSQEILYIDGTAVGSKTVTVSPFIQPYIYLGAGFLGGSYPDEPHAGQSPAAATFFYGAMSDAATWDRQLTPAEISLMYEVGTHAASLLTTITRPSGKTFEQASYDPVTADVTHVTDANGGSWSVGAPVDNGSSRKYVASVLGALPDNYWRLADTGTTTAVNQFKAGTATYSNVTQGVSGGPFADTTVDGFNGSSSSLALPNGLIGPGQQSVSLWFKTTGSNEVLLSSSVDPVTDTTTASTYVPNLYIGSDGHLLGEFDDQDTPMESSAAVNDGNWHNVVLAAAGSSQVLYLDGQQVGSASGSVVGGSSDGENYDTIGAGFLGWEWPDQPNQTQGSETGNLTYFTGDIAEVSFYPNQLTAASVTGEWDAAQHSPGLAPVETAQVTDPGGHTLSYSYDPLNSGRMLSQTDGLGNTTTYGYDSAGFQDQVTDPNGDVTDTGHDVRGNVVSTTTCQDQAAGICSTSYASYSPNDTSSELSAPYYSNDLVQSYRDPRSASATDNTYLTSDTYNAQGELASQTTPPVPGYPLLSGTLGAHEEPGFRHCVCR